jgi:hypothetical protein
MNSEDKKMQQNKKKGKGQGKSNKDERVFLKIFYNGFKILTMDTSDCFGKFLQ